MVAMKHLAPKKRSGGRGPAETQRCWALERRTGTRDRIQRVNRPSDTGALPRLGQEAAPPRKRLTLPQSSAEAPLFGRSSLNACKE